MARRAEATARTTFPGSPILDHLTTADGLTWASFRRTLEPSWQRVWLDIAGRYAMLALGLVAISAACAWWGAWAGLALAPLAALWLGYWFASVVLFIHEAAHYNLHPDKASNDRLANLIICPLLADDIAGYRALHWQHHLNLGRPGDTEVSYHYAPDFRFFVETLFGVHLLRVFREHRRARSETDGPSGNGRSEALALARGVALHGAILGVTLWNGWWGAALAWALAAGVVFPFLSAVRQQLEHRSLSAQAAADYAREPHGPINRMFERTAFARTFGAAGFDRHLLHHWYPAASYTCFDALEEFFRSTELAQPLEEARTSYSAVWRQLVRPAVTSEQTSARPA